MNRNNSKRRGFTRTELLIVVVVIGLLAAVIIPRLVARSRAQAQANACISNLRLLDGAKHAWALEQHKQNTDTPAASDMQPYVGRSSSGELPVCPLDPKQTFDTSYLINHVGTKPTCKINPTNHILP